MKFSLIVVAAVQVSIFIGCQSFAQEVVDTPDKKEASEFKKISTTDFKPIYEADFEKGIDDWDLIDDGWKHVRSGNSKVLSLHKKKSNYKPTFRSPTHLAVLKENEVSSFQLDLRVQSTHKDYGHRDVCFFFGYQSPDEYYYVHLGKKTDPHCNQIFVVNKAERKKISLSTSEGTNWDKRWHSVRVDRDSKSGDIHVYFDDMNKPVMTAKDRTFTHGRIGVGSFDDTANFDNLKLSGLAYTTPTEPLPNSEPKPKKEPSPDK